MTQDIPEVNTFLKLKVTCDTLALLFQTVLYTRVQANRFGILLISRYLLCKPLNLCAEMRCFKKKKTNKDYLTPRHHTLHSPKYSRGKCNSYYV